MRDFLSKRVVSLEPSGIRKFFDIVSEMPDAISLGVGEPDFDTPWRVREEGIYSLERGRTFYTSNAGLKELRYEISEYLERKYELVYDPNHEIIVTVGGSEGIDIAMRSCDDEVEEMRIAYNQRRRFLVHEFQRMGIECFEPEGAFYIFPSIKKFGMTSEEFATKLLNEEKVAIVPGSAFGACGEGYLRVSYAYSIEELKEALGRLERFINHLPKKQ